MEPIGSFIDLGAVSTASLRAAIEEALQAVDTVHMVEPGLPTVPLRETGGHHRLGGYRYWADGSPEDIVISRDAGDPGFTLLHELGHFLDHHALGTAGTFSSSAGELPEWLAVAEASQAFARLTELEAQAPIAFPSPGSLTVIFDPEDFAYRLAPDELFARSYGQWIASRSGEARLCAELRAAQMIVYPEQWNDQDFEPIAAALDQLLGS